MSSMNFKGVEVDSKKLERFNFTNLKPDEKDKIWDINCLFNKEVEHIKKYFREKILELSMLKGNLTKDEEKKFWEEKWKYIENQLEKTYLMNPDTIKKEEIEKAKKHYKEQCPSVEKILVWRIVFWLSVIGETLILVVQGLAGGGFNLIILLFAFLLALGGWFCGNFLGAWFWQNNAEKTGTFNPKRDSISRMELFQLFLGVILILFVATIRAVFSTESTGIDFNSMYVFTLTIILGLVVAGTEGSCIYLKKKRNWCLTNQEDALKMYASEQHADYLKKGVYRNEFFRLVEEIPKENEEGKEVKIV